MAQEELTGRGKTVCVTGASGFIGSHVVKQLLEKGYTVRGTVRDASNTDKYGWLNKLAEGTPGTLELFSADLEKEGSYDEAMRGCELVCHVAAVVKMKSAEPQREIVDPTVQGTKNVFSSILKARAAKRVVLTSSMAAVIQMSNPESYVHTEEDWHTELTLRHPYPMAKTLSERLAWKVYEEQKEDDGWRFELAVVNPAFVLGDILHKSHVTTSVSLIRMLVNGSRPFAPDFYWSVVHVRDVARVHVLCLEREDAKGRFIVAQDGTMSFLDAAAIAKKEYPHLPASYAALPTFVLYLMALVSPVLSADSIELMGQRRPLSSEKAKKELGIIFATPEQAILDSVKCLIDLKKLPDASSVQPSKGVFSFVDFWPQKSTSVAPAATA